MLKVYQAYMQRQVEEVFCKCFASLGWEYQPHGRHSDILNIENVYIRHGQFWCLYEDEILVGTVAVRCIDEDNKVVEMKRLYILPEYQGKGYGEQLFKTAIDYAKQEKFNIIRLDTRRDRTVMIHLIEKYKFTPIEQYNENDLAELYFELNLNNYNYEPEV